MQFKKPNALEGENQDANADREVADANAMAAGSQLPQRQGDLAAPERRRFPRNDVTNFQSSSSTHQQSAASGLVNESVGPVTWSPSLSRWCFPKPDRLDFGPEAPVPQPGLGQRATAGLATFVFLW